MPKVVIPGIEPSDKPTAGAQRVVQRRVQSPPEPPPTVKPPQAQEVEAGRPGLSTADTERERQFMIQVNGIRYFIDADEVVETEDGKSTIFRKDGQAVAVVKTLGQPEYMRIPQE